MRIPLDWLSEYVKTVSRPRARDVQEALVRVGFEEEALHDFSVSGPVVVGRVLGFVEQTYKNGKTIRWCRVQTSPEGPDRGIVCGADNFFENDLVVVALPGCVLPGGFAISARKTYGRISDGMICSSVELGLGQLGGGGILRLDELGLDASVGQSAYEVLGLDEPVVEINVTPDRGYALSLRGVAREYALAANLAYEDPARASFSSPAGLPGFVQKLAVSEAAKELVPVFYTRIVRGVQGDKPAPYWMQKRLIQVGIRPISAVVDVTNYVMLELGQPMHAYDLSALPGPLGVRLAREGERLQTLDGLDRELSSGDLIIVAGADLQTAKPVGLAGVMGGRQGEIAPGTRDVLLEAANFSPVFVARTARRQALASESSRRFERGVDQGVAEAALNRASRLIVELVGGELEPGAKWERLRQFAPIRLSQGFIESLVGAKFSPSQIRWALESLGGELVCEGEEFSLVPPSFRPDLRDRVDLVEEVVRLIGYDRIPSLIPTIAQSGSGLSEDMRFRRRLAQSLAGAGCTEVLSYPFVTREANALFAPGRVTPRIKNPLDAQAPFLRLSLLPELLRLAHRNVSRGLAELSLFEIGRVFIESTSELRAPLPEGGVRPSADLLEQMNAALPDQPFRAGVLMLGRKVLGSAYSQSQPYAWSDALETAALIGRVFGRSFSFVQGRHPAWHPGRCAEVWSGEKNVGRAGELLPTLVGQYNLSGPVVACEIELDSLLPLGRFTYRRISAHSPTFQDLTFLVESSIPAGKLLALIQTTAAPVLEEARLVDDYRGPEIDSNKKALTFSLKYSDATASLPSHQANLWREKIIGAANEAFGATMREVLE